MDTAHDEVFTDAPTSARSSSKEPKQVKGTKRKESVDSKNIPEIQERKRKQSRLPRIKKPSLPSFSSDNAEQSPVATVAKTKVDMETCTDDDLQLLTREMILDEIQLIKSYSSMSCQTDENANYVMTDGSDFESERMKSNIMSSQIITRDMMTSGTMTDDMMTSEWSQLPLIASVLSDDISHDMQEKLSTAELAQLSVAPYDIEKKLGELLDKAQTQTVTPQSGQREIDEIRSAIKSISSETHSSFSTSDNIENKPREALDRGDKQPTTLRTGVTEIDEINSARKSIPSETQTSLIQPDSTENRSGEFKDNCNKQAVTLQIVGSQTAQIMDVIKDDSPITKHICVTEYSSQHQGIETMIITIGNEILHDIRGDKAGIARGIDSCHVTKDDASYRRIEVQKQSSLSDCGHYKNVSEKYDIDNTKDDKMVTPESKEKNTEESSAHRQHLDGRSDSEQRYANDQNRMTEVLMESEILEEKPISEIACENTGFGETIKKRDNISKQGESNEISHDAKEVYERESRVDVSAESKGISDAIMKSKISQSLELGRQIEHAVDDRELSDKIPATFEEASQTEDGKNVTQTGCKAGRESKTKIPKIIKHTEVKDQVENIAVAEKVVVAKSAHLHEVRQKEHGVIIHHKSIATAESIINNKKQNQNSEISGHLEQTANVPVLSDAFSADREKSFQTKDVVDIRKGKERRASPADGTDSSQGSEFKARLENTEDDLLQREVGTAGVNESGGIEPDGRKQIIEDKNHLQKRTLGLTNYGETICASHLQIMEEKEIDKDMNKVDLKTHSSMEDGQIESSASHGAKRSIGDESLIKNTSMKGRVNERDDVKGEKQIVKGEYNTSDSSMKNEANEIAPLVKTEGNEYKGADSIEQTCLQTLPDEVGQRRGVRTVGMPMKMKDAVKTGGSDASKHKVIHEEVLPRSSEPRHELHENKKAVGQERDKEDDERHLSSFQTDIQESEKVDREDNIIKIFSLEENAKILSSLNSDSFSQSMSPSQSAPSISNISPVAAETGQFRDTIDGSKMQNNMLKAANKHEKNVDSIRNTSPGLQLVQEQRLNETSSRPVPDSDVFESSSAMNSKIHRKEALLDDNEICDIMETKSLTETKASPSLNSEKIPDSKPKTAKIKDFPSNITNKTFLSSEAAPEIMKDGKGTIDEEVLRETWPPLPGKETQIGPTSDAQIAQKSNDERETRETTVSDDAIMSSRQDTVKSHQVAHVKNIVEEQIPTCIEAGSQESEVRFEEMFFLEKGEDKKVAGAIQGNEREVTLNKNKIIEDKMSLENASTWDGGGNRKQTEKDNFSYSGKEDSRETNAEARTISAEKYERSVDDDRPKTEGQPVRGVINSMTIIKQEKSDDRINNNETSDYVVIWDDIEGHEKFENVTFEQKTVSDYVIVDKNSNNEIHCAQLQSGSTSRGNDAGIRFSLSEKEKLLSVQGEDETDGTWPLSQQMAEATNKGKGPNAEIAEDKLRDTKTIEPDLDSRQLASDTVTENLQTNIVLTDKESTHSTIIHPAMKIRVNQFSEDTTGSLEDTRIKQPTLIQNEGVSAYALSGKVLARSEMQQGEEQRKTSENPNVTIKSNGKEEIRKGANIRLSGQGMVSEAVLPTNELSLSEETVAYLPTDAVKSKSKETATTDSSSSMLNEPLEAETKTAKIDIDDRSQRSSLGQESIRRVSLTAISSLSQFKDVVMSVASEPDEGFSDIEVAETAISKKANSYLHAKVDATDEQTQSSQQNLMCVEKKKKIEDEETVIAESSAQGLGKISPKAKRRLMFELEIEEIRDGTQTLQIEVCSEEEFVEENVIRESSQRKGQTSGDEQISRDGSEQLDDFERRHHIKQANRGTEGEYLHDDSKREERGFENQQLSAKVEVEGQRNQGERALHATQRESAHKDRDLPMDKLTQLNDMGGETQIRQQKRETGRESPVQVTEKERGTKNQLVEIEVMPERPAMGQQPEVYEREKQHEQNSMRTSGEAGLGAKEMEKEKEKDEIPSLPRKQTVGQRKKLGEGSKEEKDEMPPLPRKQNVGVRKKQGEETMTKVEGEKDAKKVVSKTRESDKNTADSVVKKETIKTQLSIEKTEELVLGLLTIGSGREDFASRKLTNAQMERETRGMSNRLEEEQGVQSEKNEYKLLDSCIGKERPAEIKEAVIVENEERMRRISIGEVRIIPPKSRAVQFKEFGDHRSGFNTKQDRREVRRVAEERDSSRTTTRDATALLAIASDTQRNATGRIRGTKSSLQEEGTHLAPLQIYTHSLSDSMSYSEQSSISPTPSGTSTESEFTVALKEKDKLKKALSTVKNQYEGLLQEFDKIISTNGAESGNENVQISKESYQVALQCKEELEMEITKAREQLAFVVAAHEDQSDSSLFWQSSEYEFSEDSESFTDRSFDITDESGGFPRGKSTPVPPTAKGTKRDSSTQSGSVGEGIKDTQMSIQNKSLLGVAHSDVRKRPTPDVQERATNTSPESESDSKYRRSPRYAKPGYDSFNEAEEELGYIPISDLQRLPATLPRRRGPKRRHRGVMITEDMDPNEAKWVSRRSLVNKEQAKRNEKLTLQAIENAELKKELLLTKLEKIRLEAMLSCVMMRVSPTEVDQGFRQMSVNSITSSTSTLRSTASLTNIPQNDPGNPVSEFKYQFIF